MKATSGHFLLDDEVEFKDLAGIFPELLTTFLEETDQMPDDEDVLRMFIYLNEQELQKNSKPEGYNRKGRMRLVFPIDSKQFYIKAGSANADVVRLGEKLSKLLTKAGIGHTLQWDAMGPAAE